MKKLFILIILVLQCGCVVTEKNIPGTNLKLKSFDLNIKQKDASSRTYSEIMNELRIINKHAGHYPPSFKNEDERQEVYEKWLDLVADAEALNKSEVNSEKSLFLLSELYRHGHNMEVKNSASMAMKNMDKCLEKYPDSIQCNTAVTYFYLQIPPTDERMAKVENSLNILRKKALPGLNQEVEAGYVYFYLHQQNADKAKEQIEKFIKNFPSSPRVASFENIKKRLANGIQLKEVKE